MLMLTETVKNIKQIAFDSFYFVSFLRQKTPLKVKLLGYLQAEYGNMFVLLLEGVF